MCDFHYIVLIASKMLFEICANIFAQGEGMLKDNMNDWYSNWSSILSNSQFANAFDLNI